jgi:hypothetical protein
MVCVCVYVSVCVSVVLHKETCRNTFRNNGMSIVKQKNEINDLGDLHWYSILAVTPLESPRGRNKSKQAHV